MHTLIIRHLGSDLPDDLPRDHINILMITARPYERDVGFRSLSRPLLELLEKERLPARIDMLRPPTLQWYKKSLAIKEKQGNEHGAASTYHQLGRIAQEQRDFGAAEQWYKTVSQ
jgi:hypothetical protein